MKLETAKRIVEAAHEDGIDLHIREDYSGRSMYNKTTAGVVGTLPDFIQAVAAAAFAMGWEHDGAYDVMARELRNLRTDNMGHQTIVY